LTIKIVRHSACLRFLFSFFHQKKFLLLISNSMNSNRDLPQYYYITFCALSLLLSLGFSSRGKEEKVLVWIKIIIIVFSFPIFLAAAASSVLFHLLL
jgi:hypothetical protein